MKLVQTSINNGAECILVHLEKSISHVNSPKRLQQKLWTINTSFLHLY